MYSERMSAWWSAVTLVREIVDKQLRLVPWAAAADITGAAEDIVATCRDARTLEFTTVPADYTMDMAREFLTTDAVRWALVEGGRYCGNIELRLLSDEERAVDVGYTTAPWARGRGLMTRALCLVRDEAIALGVRRIDVCAAVDNAASRHVAEQAGFEYVGIVEGELRRGPCDMAVYRLTVEV